MTTFREFWARSAHFVQNGCWDESRGAPVLFCFLCGNPRDLLAISQWPIFTKFGHETYFGVPSRSLERHFLENFHFRGHLSPKSEIENRSNRHLTQSRLQVTGYIAERYCLHHVVVLGPGISEVWSTFVCDVRLRSYGASKLPKFSNFGQFSHTKPLKRTFR